MSAASRLIACWALGWAAMKCLGSVVCWTLPGRYCEAWLICRHWRIGAVRYLLAGWRDLARCGHSMARIR
jgi:hypothetical protein